MKFRPTPRHLKIKAVTRENIRDPSFSPGNSCGMPGEYNQKVKKKKKKKNNKKKKKNNKLLAESTNRMSTIMD